MKNTFANVPQSAKVRTVRPKPTTVFTLLEFKQNLFLELFKAGQWTEIGDSNFLNENETSEFLFTNHLMTIESHYDGDFECIRLESVSVFNTTTEEEFEFDVYFLDELEYFINSDHGLEKNLINAIRNY